MSFFIDFSPPFSYLLHFDQMYNILYHIQQIIIS